MFDRCNENIFYSSIDKKITKKKFFLSVLIYQQISKLPHFLHDSRKYAHILCAPEIDSNDYVADIFTAILLLEQIPPIVVVKL